MFLISPKIQEEQKVLEAKIRMLQRERHDEEERLRKKQSRNRVLGEEDSCEIQSSSIPGGTALECFV